MLHMRTQIDNVHIHTHMITHAYNLLQVHVDLICRCILGNIHRERERKREREEKKKHYMHSISNVYRISGLL